jgi:hypothetical protein
MERLKAREVIGQLVAEFNKGKSVFKDAHKYDEAKVRVGFLDPFFEALGWPVKESQRRVGKEREVVVEDRTGKGNRQRPDYGFYVGGELKFYVEAKQPSHDLAVDYKAMFQLKSYVWTQRAPVGVLTDFEEFLTFHGAFKPRLDKPALGRVEPLCFTFESYLDNFDLIFDTFSHDAVTEGSIEKMLASVLAASVRQRGQIERDLFKARGAKAPDADFLESLTKWREGMAKELARRNEFGSGQELTEAVQRFLDRLVFARIAEDRGIERTLTLAKALERWQAVGTKGALYGRLIEMFHRLAPQFNGGLFSPHPLSDDAKFEDDDTIVDIIKSLYFPEGQFRFDVMPVEMLGGVYEQFLGSVVRVTDGGHRAKVEVKPEVRHAGGVYYTPGYIVQAIVARTLGPLLKSKDMTPNQVLKLRIIDPACGSGSFLLGAFQYLMEWHLRYYAEFKEAAQGSRGGAYRDAEGGLHLSLRKKREILVNCIYGVDLDPQAVEVAQMSLYLKLLEGEAEETIALQRSLEMYKADKYLPDLSHNLYCGNSLIASQDLDPQVDWTAEDERRINAFDWQAENTGFGSIMRQPEQGGQGGFDAVIGNPPYIRVQALTEWAPVEVELYKKLYSTAAEGNYDIYVIFIERSLKLLCEGGRLGFIVPTKWWQAAYGAPLRRLLGKGRHCEEVLDFADEQVFEDPTTYTCVACFTKKPASALMYHRVSPPELRKRGGDQCPALWEHRVPWDELGVSPWYPGVRSSLRPLFNRLRAQGPFLNDPSICPRVFQGLKTGLDPVFVLDVVTGATPTYFSKALDTEVRLESALLHPLVKGREMKRFAPLEPRKVVLFPYAAGETGTSLISARVFKEEYPLAWHYLEQNRQKLEARERGKWKGPGWYQYSRNQALDVVSRPKILTPDLVDRSLFSLDRKGSYYLMGGAAGGYGLLPARAEFVEPLLALLNSSLLEWMLRPPGLSSPFRGGWFSCEARFINLLPIHLPANAADLAALGALAERAATAYSKLNAARSDRDKNLASRQAEAAESEIDDRVYRIYGVTEHERQAVSEAVAEARASAQPDVEQVDATD